MSEDLSIMNHDSPKEQTANRLPWRQIVLLLVLILIIWLPRGFELDRYVATDEVVWLLRSANFYYALGQGDYAATYICCDNVGGNSGIYARFSRIPRFWAGLF